MPWHCTPKLPNHRPTKYQYPALYSFQHIAQIRFWRLRYDQRSNQGQAIMLNPKTSLLPPGGRRRYTAIKKPQSIQEQWVIITIYTLSSSLSAHITVGRPSFCPVANCFWYTDGHNGEGQSSHVLVFCVNFERHICTHITRSIKCYLVSLRSVYVPFTYILCQSNWHVYISTNFQNVNKPST